MLEDTFGDEYREYKERTGSLLNWRLKRRQRKMQSSMLDEL